MRNLIRINLEESQEHQEKANEILLAQALERNHGNPAWRGWKKEEAMSLVDLSNRASRMRLVELDLEGDLGAKFHLMTPVPREPVDGKLQVGTQALFGLRYEERWRWETPPGWAMLGLLHPGDAFFPTHSQRLKSICLGDLPIGVRPREIVLLGFFAVTLQNIQLDETDPHGVLNVRACEYFRSHPEWLPLTRDGFHDPVGD